MKKTLIVAACSTLLAACGGGGSDSSSPVNNTPALTPLSVYAGTWQSPCDDYEIDTLTLSNKADGSLEVTIKAEHFQSASCAGAPIATQTTTTNPSISYLSTADTAVQAGIGKPPTTTRIDKVNINIPPHNVVVTGPGVQRVVESGQAKWCFNVNSTSRTCIDDPGTTTAQASTGGMYISGNTLYLLSPTGPTYTVDEFYTRK
ncbi:MULTISPECIES: hypothetical protein [unclassified Janthinobacterium]|uniref:hypothetical protein n=1 Tax=unclassified Janthinobacterium TaxID=2610881 RepID=UPI0016196409|nr:MULTISPECIES: hypothetical protein [unclassified Janthinobacterium]MBB5367201.1 hypothetical protein [Janthinobacterium sp. K2C7]MBB5380321.1 hypothetical protein [Janthinobacterium sp. K2Li3]MBB5385583.1 hypothetical protein [Janthinobacterium sp. K2E3]